MRENEGEVENVGGDVRVEHGGVEVGDDLLVGGSRVAVGGRLTGGAGLSAERGEER